MVRVAAALRIGTPQTRAVAGILYALAPRMLGDLGSISSEIWPVALAPWVLLPVVRVLQGRMSPRRGGAGAALALALMGAVMAAPSADAVTSSPDRAGDVATWRCSNSRGFHVPPMLNNAAESASFINKPCPRRKPCMRPA